MELGSFKHTGTASCRPGGLLQLPSFLMFLCSYIRVAFHYLDKNMMKKNDYEYDMSTVGLYSNGVVAKLDKGYKKIRTDPVDSYKDGAGTKGANI
ncbi:hypothetical protein E2C01_040212 [Portunus trituberculatus]|uniref:Uncharacterized protein n=1 Tax=Portunus trituberculatus TaxID=210409 RepID=A0A5B7FJ32_PORTR|nr:hypothetical protein [Portunus trituberculatus]